MKIVVGRGKGRHVFERPLDKDGRKAMARDLKNFLFRKA